VGYVGRDVESMNRYRMEMTVRIVKEEKMEKVKDGATEAANKKLVKLLVHEVKKQKNVKNPLEMFFPNVEEEDEKEDTSQENDVVQRRKQIAQLLELGELEDKVVQVEIEEQPPSMFDMLQ